MSMEVAFNKFDEGTLRDYITFNLFISLSYMFLKKKIFYNFALPVKKMFGIPEPLEQNLKRPSQRMFC
jgi:hypothetical protein